MNVADPAVEAAYAGLGRRVAAGVLDAVFLFFAWSFTFGNAVPESVREGHPVSDSEQAVLGLLTLAFLTLAFNYFAVGEWRWGRTLGKMALQIKVTALDGGAVSWNRAVVRNLLLLPDLLLGFLLIPTSERRQRLGDRWAKTVVVRDFSRVTSETLPASSAPPPAPPEPEPEPPAAPWGGARTVGGIAALIVLVVVEAGIVAAFDADISSLSARLALQAMLAATMVAVAVAVARGGGAAAPLGALGLRRPLRPAVKLTVLAYLVYIGCALVISALLQPEQEDITRDLGFGEGLIGSIAAGLLIVGAAPISEEVFFRGFMFAGIRRGAPFALAAAVSAGVWGLFHFTGPGSWGVVLQLAVFGVILAWLYERTGSIWPPIAVHAFNNALAFAILTS